MSERLLATVPVFTFLINDSNEVYLQRRYQTGYLDGYYEPPAGKMDNNGESAQEAACREAHEESGVLVLPEDIELFHTYLNLSEGKPWLGLMFRTRTWAGTPTIQEADKCDDAKFFGYTDLPKLTPQVRDGIARLLISPAIEMSNYTDISNL